MVRGSNNPVVAVQTAAEAGLLTYLEFSDTGFRVRLAGREMILPEESAPETMRRLRMINDLRNTGAQVSLVELRDDGVFVLRAGRIRHEVAGADLRDWLRGYEAAAAADGQQHVGDDQLAETEQVLRNPGRDDQCRMVLLGIMAERSVSADKLRDLLRGPDKTIKPPTKKTVVDALGFGNPLSSSLADRMISALGCRWAISASGGVAVQQTGEPGAPVRPVPEAPAVLRLRMILAASDAGWLRYVGTPRVNWARRARTYEFMVGERAHMVSRNSLPAWLAGMAAFHGVAEVPTA